MVVKHAGRTVGKGHGQSVAQAKGLMVDVDIMNEKGIERRVHAVLGVAGDLLVNDHALAEFAAVAVEAGAVHHAGGVERILVAVGVFDGGADGGNRFDGGNQRDSVHLGRKVEDAVRLGEHHNAGDIAADAVEILHRRDKMLGGGNGTFEILMNAARFVLAEVIVRGGDAPLPAFDLENDGNALLNHEKILFEVAVAPRDHNVADHAVKIFAQKAIDCLLAAGAEGLNLGLFGKRQGVETAMQTAKERFGHWWDFLLCGNFGRAGTDR